MPKTRRQKAILAAEGIPPTPPQQLDGTPKPARAARSARGASSEVENVSPDKRRVGRPKGGRSKPDGSKRESSVAPEETDGNARAKSMVNQMAKRKARAREASTRTPTTTRKPTQGIYDADGNLRLDRPASPPDDPIFVSDHESEKENHVAPEAPVEPVTPTMPVNRSWGLSSIIPSAARTVSRFFLNRTPANEPRPVATEPRPHISATQGRQARVALLRGTNVESRTRACQERKLLEEQLVCERLKNAAMEREIQLLRSISPLTTTGPDASQIGQKRDGESLTTTSLDASQIGQKRDRESSVTYGLSADFFDSDDSIEDTPVVKRSRVGQEDSAQRFVRESAPSFDSNHPAVKRWGPSFEGVVHPEDFPMKITRPNEEDLANLIDSRPSTGEDFIPRFDFPPFRLLQDRAQPAIPQTIQAPRAILHESMDVRMAATVGGRNSTNIFSLHDSQTPSRSYSNTFRVPSPGSESDEEALDSRSVRANSPPIAASPSPSKKGPIVEVSTEPNPFSLKLQREQALKHTAKTPSRLAQSAELSPYSSPKPSLNHTATVSGNLDALSPANAFSRNTSSFRANESRAVPKEGLSFENAFTNVSSCNFKENAFSQADGSKSFKAPPKVANESKEANSPFTENAFPPEARNDQNVPEAPPLKSVPLVQSNVSKGRVEEPRKEIAPVHMETTKVIDVNRTVEEQWQTQHTQAAVQVFAHDYEAESGERTAREIRDSVSQNWTAKHTKAARLIFEHDFGAFVVAM